MSEYDYDTMGRLLTDIGLQPGRVVTSTATRAATTAALAAAAGDWTCPIDETDRTRLGAPNALGGRAAYEAIKMAVDLALGSTAEYFNAVHLVAAWATVITGGDVSSVPAFLAGQSSLGAPVVVASGSSPPVRVATTRSALNSSGVKSRLKRKPHRITRWKNSSRWPN